MVIQVYLYPVVVLIFVPLIPTQCAARVCDTSIEEDRSYIFTVVRVAGALDPCALGSVKSLNGTMLLLMKGNE